MVRKCKVKYYAKWLHASLSTLAPPKCRPGSERKGLKKWHRTWQEHFKKWKAFPYRPQGLTIPDYTPEFKLQMQRWEADLSQIRHQSEAEGSKPRDDQKLGSDWDKAAKYYISKCWAEDKTIGRAMSQPDQCWQRFSFTSMLMHFVTYKSDLNFNVIRSLN